MKKKYQSLILINIYYYDISFLLKKKKFICDIKFAYVENKKLKNKLNKNYINIKLQPKKKK